MLFCMKIKICAGWDSSENVTKRLLDQFKTDNNHDNEFVYDDSYDLIVFNNYVTEEPKQNSKAYIFFHEPTWSGNHQKTFSQYRNITIFGYDKNNYDSPENVIETPACLFYGGAGQWREGNDFWNYNNLKEYPFNKDKNISSIVSTLGNDERSYSEGCIYKKRIKAITSIIEKCNFIDVYGWGDKHLPLKKDGLIRYKFSICIENSSEKNYISEKFYDCILTNTIPIYFGCKNIRNFLPEAGYFLIENIDDTKTLIDQLNYININSEKLYEQMLPELLKIKKKYFNDLNLLTRINNLVLENEQAY